MKLTLSKSIWLSVGPLLVLAGFYSYTLSFGFLWDDAWEVIGDLERANERIQFHFRPLFYYFSVIKNEFLWLPWHHRLVNLGLLLMAAYLTSRATQMLDISVGFLLVCAIFLHPTFIFPTTYISQHFDFWLIIFTLLIVLNFEKRRGILYVLLSNLAKSPFIFQNIWYSYQKWQQPNGKKWALIALIPIPLILGHNLIFWLGVETASTSPMANLTVTGITGDLFALGVRLIKVLEGIFLIHVPLAGFYDAATRLTLFVVGSLYLFIWSYLWLSIIRSKNDKRHGMSILCLAALMSIPFAINSDPRVLGPALPFFYLGVFSLAPRTKLTTVCIMGLLGLNSIATILNYRISDTGSYTPQSTEEYTLCGAHEMQFPMERWRCDRGQFAERLISKANNFLTH